MNNHITAQQYADMRCNALSSFVSATTDPVQTAEEWDAAFRTWMEDTGRVERPELLQLTYDPGIPADVGA